MALKKGKDKVKLPPQSLETEQAVLGALLIDKNSIFKIADVLAPEDFYAPAHEKIYETILELHEKRKPVDILTLTERLKEKEFLKDVGGSSYLAELTNRVSTSSHIEHYAQTIKEKRTLRDLIKASAEITENAFEPDKELEEILDDIEQKIFSISQKSSIQNFVPIKDELGGAFERIEKLHEGQDKLRGIPTGFRELDNILSGLQKSDLVILGARPSLGKTSLTLDIARQAAEFSGQPVGFFSLEMSREQVIDRLIAAESQVPLWRLRNGRVADETEFQMIRNALDKLSRTPIFIDDTPSPNIMQMRSMARRLQMEKGLGLLIVDYLQLIAPRGRFDNMVQQITEVSRGLKGLAKELNIPILAVSQLSRAVDQRVDKTPQLSDLRESGSIEQDADVVLFISRKDRNRADLSAAEQNTAEILVAKHRNGPLGTIRLSFDPETVSFRSVEKRFGEGVESEILIPSD